MRMDRSREEWALWIHGMSEAGLESLFAGADEILLALADERRKAVEECAKVADGYPCWEAKDIAERIRAKPLPASGTEREGTKP
jgi:hypothetical protein